MFNLLQSVMFAGVFGGLFGVRRCVVCVQRGRRWRQGAGRWRSGPGQEGGGGPVDARGRMARWV